MNLCGPGATACRHRIINQLSSKLPFDCDPFADEAVTSTHTTRVVTYYKHMGAASTARGSMTLEAKARAGSMFSQFRKGRTRLYSNVNITVEARHLYVRSLLFSRLLFDSGTWTALTSSAANIVNNAYITPLRVVHGMKYDVDNKSNRYNNHQVLVQAGFPMLEHQLMINRCKYLGSFLRYASPQHARLVLLQRDVPTSWFSLVRSDINWI